MVDPPKQSYALRGHSSSVGSVCFLDRDHLLSGSEDGTVALWSLRRRRKVNEYAVSNSNIMSINVIGRDPKKIFVQDFRGSISVFDSFESFSAGKKPLPLLNLDSCGFCKICPLRWPSDGDSLIEMFVCPSSDSDELQLWDTRGACTRKFFRSEKRHGKIMCCRFVEGSRSFPRPSVVVGTESGHVCFIDFLSMEICLEGKIHDDVIFCLDIDKEVMRGVSCSSKQDIIIWQTHFDSKGINVIEVFKLQDAYALCAEIRNDQKLIACGCSDGKLRLYRLEKPVHLATLHFHLGGIKSVAFNNERNGETAAGSSDSKISLWHIYE